MLKPSDFFDLSSPFTANLFGGCEYVWDILKRLDELTLSLTGRKQTVLGEVMAGAVPYVLAMLGMAALLIAFPALALWLPGL